DLPFPVRSAVSSRDGVRAFLRRTRWFSLCGERSFGRPGEYATLTPPEAAGPPESSQTSPLMADRRGRSRHSSVRCIDAGTSQVFLERPDPGRRGAGPGPHGGGRIASVALPRTPGVSPTGGIRPGILRVRPNGRPFVAFHHVLTYSGTTRRSPPPPGRGAGAGAAGSGTVLRSPGAARAGAGPAPADEPVPRR